MYRVCRCADLPRALVAAGLCSHGVGKGVFNRVADNSVRRSSSIRGLISCHVPQLSLTRCSSNERPLQHDALRPWISKVGEQLKINSERRHLHIVLFEPKIAGNTGSIARTCAATSVGLHLIEPLGFQIDDTKLKRAGLDYWPYVFVKLHASWSDFMQYFQEQEEPKRLVAFTKRGTCLYTGICYSPGDWLVFGAETTGLSAEALADCADESRFGGGKVRIPMMDTYVRSLNLAVSVGVGLYEALRQLNVLPNLMEASNEGASLDDLTGDVGDGADSRNEQCFDIAGA